MKEHIIEMEKYAQTVKKLSTSYPQNMDNFFQCGKCGKLIFPLILYDIDC